MSGKCPRGQMYKYVNVYLEDRAYGGPEEGGWYYDCGEPVSSIACDNDTEVSMYRRLMGEWCDKQNKDRPPVHSVASEGVFVSVVEDNPARGYPSERPYYE